MKLFDTLNTLSELRYIRFFVLNMFKTNIPISVPRAVAVVRSNCGDYTYHCKLVCYCHNYLFSNLICFCLIMRDIMSSLMSIVDNDTKKNCF